MAKKKSKKKRVIRGMGIVEVLEHQQIIMELYAKRYPLTVIFDKLKKEQKIKQSYSTFYRNVKIEILNDK